MNRVLFLFCCSFGCLLNSSFAAELPPPPAKVVRYAATMIQRYDTNGDGMLQREEWQKMPGTPQAIDLNGDGSITKDELIWYFIHYGQSRTIHRTVVRDLSEPYKFDPKNMRFLRPVWQQMATPPVAETEATQEVSDDELEALMKANEQPVDDDIYQKILEERQVLVSRPYHVLPESLRGVPAWFIVLDKNGDGQISLYEFAPTLERRRVQLFQTLDKNGNGFIEPHEVRR